MQLLQEAIKTFTKWVDGKRLADAVTAWGSFSKTQDGQKQILAAAATGDVTAADYLFAVYTKIIAKAFWAYYLGPQKQYHKQRLSSGADEDFASVAYGMLLGVSEPSPYKTFDASKFSEQADLIKQFGYYVYRYLQNEAMKMIRAEKMGGLSGNVEKDTKIQTVGYEDHFENSEETSVGSFAASVDLKETLRAFLATLKHDNETLYKVFRGRLQGKSVADVAAELGVTGQSVRNYLKTIQQLYNKFVGE